MYWQICLNATQMIYGSVQYGGQTKALPITPREVRKQRVVFL